MSENSAELNIRMASKWFLQRQEINEYLKDYKLCDCFLKSDYAKVVWWDEAANSILTKRVCLGCQRNIVQTDAASIKKEIHSYFELKECAVLGIYNYEQYSSSGAIQKILQEDWMKMCKISQDITVQIVGSVPQLTKHTTWIYERFPKFCKDCMEHKNVQIRKEFAKYSMQIIANMLEHKTLKNTEKQALLKKFIDDLMAVTRQSIFKTDYDLQETAFETLEKVCKIENSDILVASVNMLVLLIMAANSKQSLLAVEAFNSLTKRHNTTTSNLYKTHKQEMCRRIMNLCTFNLSIADWDLFNSLGRISLVLGFFGTKDFLVKELPHLLPHLIVLVLNRPSANKLLIELLAITDQHISDVLRTYYSNIFLHIFLEENEETFKSTMKYLEANASMSGSSLRKRNFKVSWS